MEVLEGGAKMAHDCQIQKRNSHISEEEFTIINYGQLLSRNFSPSGLRVPLGQT